MKAHNDIKTISLIGAGNVATILGKALDNAGLDILNVYSRDYANSVVLADMISAKAISDLDKIGSVSDLYIICVPDDRIQDIANNMPDVSGIVVHTSGSIALSVLDKFNQKGIFYPLQTLTKDSNLNLKEVPICIESHDDTTLQSLRNLGEKLSERVVQLSSEQRQYLHMTAVIVNNFTNFMYGMAHELLNDEGIDFSLLVPLIQETAQKISHSEPQKSQTGPARRKDQLTIKRHLELLDKHPEYQNIYRLLSEQLIKKYHE